MTAASAPSAPRSRLALAFWPAVITLAVTIARLLAELNHLPKWLANDAAGGFGAAIGIVWLPALFGPWFAWRISPELATFGARVRRLVSTLVVYGYLARVPVFLLFFLDRAFGWHTHYANVGERGPKEFWTQVELVARAQLLLWPLVWTVGVGTLFGMVVLAMRRPSVQPA